MAAVGGPRNSTSYTRVIVGSYLWTIRIERTAPFSNMNVSDVPTGGLLPDVIDGSDLCLNSSAAVTDILQFNFSEYDYPGEDGGPWPASLGLISALKITFCIINMIVSLLGNTAVIVAVYHNPALRSTLNFYLVNVAVADVLIALCCMWTHLVNDLTKPAFVLGAFMCKFNAFAQMTCLTSSVLTLTAISCDRFMAVMYPLRVRITQCRARAVIITIWIISTVVAIPFAVFRKLFEIQWKNAVEVTCQETWPVMRVYYDPVRSACVSSIWPKTAYYSLVSTTLFFLPIIVMTIAYALIIARLWGSKPPGEKMDATVSNQAKATRKVVKMVLVILLVFMICWIPLQVLILYAQFSHNSLENGELPEWYDQVMFLVYSIAYTNSTLNPLLYGGLNQTYRKTLIRVLCRKCHWASRDSNASMQGSIQLAEMRDYMHRTRVDGRNNVTTTFTRTSRFAVKRERPNGQELLVDNSPSAIIPSRNTTNYHQALQSAQRNVCISCAVEAVSSAPCERTSMRREPSEFKDSSLTSTKADEQSHSNAFGGRSSP